MLHLDTVTRSTLALLKTLQGMPELRRTRLVGGTALALQLGHRLSEFNVLQSLAYFEDAESEPMPKLLKPCNWGEVKTRIIHAVRSFQGKS